MKEPDDIRAGPTVDLMETFFGLGSTERCHLRELIYMAAAVIWKVALWRNYLNILPKQKKRKLLRGRKDHRVTAPQFSLET